VTTNHFSIGSLPCCVYVEIHIFCQFLCIWCVREINIGIEYHRLHRGMTSFQKFLPSSLFVLLIRICTVAEQEVGAIGVAQGDGVEEGRAPVVVGEVDLGVTQADLWSQFHHACLYQTVPSYTKKTAINSVM